MSDKNKEERYAKNVSEILSQLGRARYELNLLMTACEKIEFKNGSPTVETFDRIFRAYNQICVERRQVENNN
jgi:hypothetical protein